MEVQDVNAQGKDEFILTSFQGETLDATRKYLLPLSSSALARRLHCTYPHISSQI